MAEWEKEVVDVNVTVSDDTVMLSRGWSVDSDVEEEGAVGDEVNDAGVGLNTTEFAPCVGGES